MFNSLRAREVAGTLRVICVREAEINVAPIHVTVSYLVPVKEPADSSRTNIRETSPITSKKNVH